MGGDRFRYGCVLELQMAEGGGSKCYDQSGYGNDGAIYGARWERGPIVYALSFDGVDDYVEVPHSASLNLVDKCTIEAWVKNDDLTVDWLIAGKGGGWNRRGWLLCNVWKEPSRVRFHWQAGTDFYLDSIGHLTEGKYHHVVATMDGSYMRIYIDGKLDNERPNTQSADTTYPVLIGYEATMGRKPLKGSIGMVRLYGRALAAKEIFGLYSYVMHPTIKVPR